MVIGRGGDVVRGICETTGAHVNIAAPGTEERPEQYRLVSGVESSDGLGLGLALLLAWGGVWVRSASRGRAARPAPPRLIHPCMHPSPTDRPHHATPHHPTRQVTVAGSVMAVCWAVELVAQKAGLFEGHSQIDPVFVR